VSLTVQGLNKFITVEASTELEESVSNYTLTIYYTPEEVAAAGLNETDLGIYWYNETLESWQLLDNDTMDWVRATGVNTSSHYVWAVVTHFSDYTIAQTTQTQEVPLQQGWNLISLPLV
jgi:hypothetical protein